MCKLKRGKYYVGDPCYIFDQSWFEIVNKIEHIKTGGQVVELFRKRCYIGNTEYGDGIYRDNKNRWYNVDTGLIAVLPVSLVARDGYLTVKAIEKHGGMHIIDFKQDFEVRQEGGVLYFGEIIIDTKGVDFNSDDEI